MTKAENFLSLVTIVGMRFYPGAHAYLLHVSKYKDIFDQQLYLVAELDSQHDVAAIMLHNGKQKLGNVAATEAPAIKRLFAEWKAESKFDEVVVCSIDRIENGYESNEFPYVSAVKIKCRYRVNERLARKYADQSRKD